MKLNKKLVFVIPFLLVLVFAVSVTALVSDSFSIRGKYGKVKYIDGHGDFDWTKIEFSSHHRGMHGNANWDMGEGTLKIYTRPSKAHYLCEEHEDHEDHEHEEEMDMDEHCDVEHYEQDVNDCQEEHMGDGEDHSELYMHCENEHFAQDTEECVEEHSMSMDDTMTMSSDYEYHDEYYHGDAYKQCKKRDAVYHCQEWHREADLDTCINNHLDYDKDGHYDYMDYDIDHHEARYLAKKRIKRQRLHLSFKETEVLQNDEYKYVAIADTWGTYWNGKRSPESVYGELKIVLNKYNGQTKIEGWIENPDGFAFKVVGIDTNYAAY